MVTRKVWTKLKNGMFGYKSSRAVKYRCERRTVTQGNTASIMIENESEIALGEGNKSSGNKEWISGMGESGESTDWIRKETRWD